ncbi:conjugal transfer protein TraI [Chitinophaga polysaccharea]|uniref:conjugal transfer protein TraI n=1 Tax=Chitinophaga polysaccharea TaxID=1293035 RepID=UPI0011578309|nr:conjugal transfer protein TraI [Chitinophaga polysaccharea]
MKRTFLKTALTGILILMATVGPVQKAEAVIPLAIIEVIKAGIKKVIKAVDLQIQRQQNKIIWLQNAQKELENVMSKLKLKEISEWTEKQRKQYDQYFQELWKIKNAISTWTRVKDVIQRQLQLVEEYKRAWNLLKSDRRFTPQEIDYMYRVYSGLLDESLKNIEQLAMVVNAFRTQMSDGQRLEFISTISAKLEKNVATLRSFSDHNFRLSLTRAKSAQEAEQVRRLYGLTP